MHNALRDGRHAKQPGIAILFNTQHPELEMPERLRAIVGSLPAVQLEPHAFVAGTEAVTIRVLCPDKEGNMIPCEVIVPYAAIEEFSVNNERLLKFQNGRLVSAVPELPWTSPGLGNALQGR